MNLHLWNRSSTGKARTIIKGIIAASPSPLSVQQIYRLAVKSELPEGVHEHGEHYHGITPPHPNNAIRSMSYLKHVVLPDLARRKELEKVHSIRTLTPEELEQRLQTLTKSARKAADLSTTTDVWLWQAATPKPVPAPKPPKPLYGVEVGAGADWSHLNKRRQRARVGKVQRDIKWMRQLEKARQLGAADQQQASS
ncbi:hypothetical protein NLI96_g11652 [Meripilus lineatus]|uniref:Uncharacterized protein n=1 Tax=Meripilus lineatus TaxID=2056292 RepID=A0AAD5Y8Y0_9APHY|nr:hypothetical protein NLI96_g11652 [Physisporinus lineatus]